MLKEVGERAQEQDVAVAVEELSFGQQSDVQELERERALAAKATKVREAPQRIRHAIIGLAAADEIKGTKLALQVIYVTLTERAIVVNPQAEGLVGEAQQALEARKASLDLGLAQEGSNHQPTQSATSFHRRLYSCEASMFP
jgi:hypothetical protein